MLGRRRRATKDRLDSCQQLLETERLRHVVVRAEVQPADAVGRRVACGEEDHGHVDPVAAHALQDLEAVELGHRDVEDDEIGCRRCELGHGVSAVRRGLDLEADESEPDRDEVGDVLLVVDNQDAQSLRGDRQAHPRRIQGPAGETLSTT